MSRIILYALSGVLALIIVGGISYFSGANHALGNMGIETITADQAAQAMSDDDFYGLYRNKTLVVSGTVYSIEQQDADTVIDFQTNLVSKTSCDLGAAQTTVKTGDAVRVIAEGFVSERIPSGVLLKPCVILN